MRDEGGFTIVELLVGIICFVAIFGVIMEMTTLATHSQDRIARRVAADQRARPTMTRIMDALHSACVAPRVAPIASGSTATSMTFVSKTGSAVTPVPDRRVLTLGGTTLTETVYPATGGAAPSWTFSSTPTSTRRVLTNVTGTSGAVFRYFDYDSGVLSTTPLPVPLSLGDAARTANVTVSLTVQPPGGTSSLDGNSPITISDSADLRLESAGQLTTEDNLPCM